jgi:cephalosporin-C deacetylase-like acetyl esterase
MRLLPDTARRRLAGNRWTPTVLMVTLALSGSAVVSAQEAEDLHVFWEWVRWTKPGSLLIDHYIRQADRLYDVRDREIAGLKSRSDWLKRQERVRSALGELLGPFPQRTPLNPRVMGVIQKDGYRVEKIIYESMPGFFVTGCLFVPETTGGRAPAILNVVGHNQDAFRDELYQIVYLNLVRKGFVVLAIDPIGQGEDVQYYDPGIQLSSIGYSVIEHCYFGNQCFLAGVSPARYFTWDGIRGIDYLQTRPEVDPSRIGVTGFSGGGTVTSYIGAVDERVKVAVPCSWPTASRRQTETKGTQDAETVLVRGLAKGITFEDLIEVRAPRPTLMTFTTRDEYLSIQGAREAFQEIRRAYGALGQEENVALVEDDYKHWMTPPIRSAIYAFFMKHLGVPGDPAEEAVEILPKEELKVTPTGQISTFLKSETVFSVNKTEAARLLESLEASRTSIDTHLNRVRSRATELSGYNPPGNYSPDPFFNGRYQRQGYSVGRYAIRGEGDYVIPLLLFVPAAVGKDRTALVYLHPQGKAAQAGPGGEIEALVRRGYVVAAVDPLGVGETKNTVIRAIADGYTGVMIGRSTVGIQAGDISRAVRYLRTLEGVDPARIGAVGIGDLCIPLIHAAALEPSIEGLVLAGSLSSYRCVAMNRIYRIGLLRHEGGGNVHPYEVDFSWGVGGALTAYDLPDLLGCMAPRRVVLSGLKNQLLRPASDQEVETDMAFPRRAYAHFGAAGNLRVVPATEDLGPLVDWAVSGESLVQ